MPLPPKFVFQERQGRINWRTVLNSDLDKIVKDVDLRQLECLLQNLTYAQLDREDIERMGDAHFVKLFRLAQMSIEYLIYTQNYLETLTKTLDLQYKHSYEETIKIREKIKQQTSENHVLKREFKLKQKTLSTYEYLLKLPAGQEQEYFKCKQCPKFFISRSFLEKHYSKQHAEKDFNVDYKDQKWGVLDEKPKEKEVKVKKDTSDELFVKIKNELAAQLLSNLKRVEVEIETLKKAQINVS